MAKYIKQKHLNDLLSEDPSLDFEQAYAVLLAKFDREDTRKVRKRVEKLFDKAVLSLGETGIDPVGPVIGGEIASPETRREVTRAKTLVLTSAQSNTLLHDAFFASLKVFCEENEAELHISRFEYNKKWHKDGSKPGSTKDSDDEGTWYDPAISEYVSDVSMQLSDDLVWCGELNIIPTRANPISGFLNYTRGASAIIPHAKMFMQSIPTMKSDPAKMIYTTGAVTQRNYIQKAAGQKADFHHVFGALVVEIAEDDTWWVRQINAGEDGTFYDLNTLYTPVEAVRDQPVAAITHGDIHGYKLNTDIIDAVFQDGGILDQLRPEEQFFHDTIDFMPRNHHNIKDPHFLHEMHVEGTERVTAEFDYMAEVFMSLMHRSWCKSFIVVSNHDQAIEGWLRNSSAVIDPPNMRDWHWLNMQACSFREAGLKFHPFKFLLEYYMARHLDPRDGEGPDMPQFLLEDDSYKINGQIEAALHGHLGPSGARGTPRNIGHAGKVNSGHTHSAGIFEGVYTAGVYGKLDMGYNKGLSAWSHSMIVTYPNSKRAILTIKNGKAWR